MQLISAIKFQKSYHQLEFLNQYKEKLLNLNNEIVLDLAPSINADKISEFNTASDLIEDSLEESVQSKPKVFVIISTDRGLAGEFLTSLKRWVINNKEALKNNKTVLVGKKLNNLIKQIQSEILNRHSIRTNTAAEEFVELLTQELSLYSQLNSEIILVSTKFRSGKLSIEEESLDFSKAVEEDAKELMTFKLEPNYLEVSNTIKNQLLRVQLLTALQNSHVSEQFSRMVYMQTATDSAAEIISTLQLSYNKSRQAAITQEISEIVGGMSVESISQTINNLNKNISINLSI